MEHHVFRDLAPAYIDQLTSAKTSKQMESHMDQCADCRNYLQAMQKEFNLEVANEQKEEHEGIDYFKKVRSKNKKKIFVTIASVLSVFLILIIIYYFVFVNMWLADVNSVETTIEQQEGTVTLAFQSKNEHRYLITQDEQSDKGYIENIFVYEKRDDFSNAGKLLKGGVSTTYTFVDENTLLLNNGDEYHIKDDDKVSIQYKDQNETIALKDLYEKGQ